MTIERDDRDEADDLSWDDAVAMFDNAAPVEVDRGSRTLRVEYRRRPGGWRATSPDVPDFDILGISLADTKRRVREDLASWLDTGVEVVERQVSPSKAVAVPLLLLIEGDGESLNDAPMSMASTAVAATA
ncbi:hypothetical protein AB0M44_08100 [Streptosporangium subroseum]|uniref:hypothetical protein n=1 Tax=Streptosporangium subroseum TaxID=106412 RepID=UPI00341BCE8A